MKKYFKIIVPKKKELYFFFALYLVRHFEKGFQDYSSKKKGTIFFLAFTSERESKFNFLVQSKKHNHYIYISSYIEPDTILWIFMGMPDGACANSWLRTVFTFAPMFAISFLDHQLQDPKTSLRHGLVALPVCKEHGSTACWLNSCSGLPVYKRINVSTACWINSCYLSLHCTLTSLAQKYNPFLKVSTWNYAI